tara:strand:+ start:4805 stop:5992 length:1188 start_codon:yes stop_codon:yes gene_type:complete
MSIYYIFKYLLLFSLFILIHSCKTVDKIKDINFSQNNDTPKVLKFEKDSKINITNSLIIEDIKKIKYLSKIKKNHNQFDKLITVYQDELFYTFNTDSKLFINNSNNGELVDSIEFNNVSKNETLISFLKNKNYFLLAYNNGQILKKNLDGQILWQFSKQKVFNSKLYLKDNTLIVFYKDEIIGLNINDGKVIWSEKYNSLPIIQSKGGQLINFLNNIYFIMPNSKLGSFDLLLGLKNNNKFLKINTINSTNNSKDKIYLYKNYLIYLDEGNILYTYDILLDKFILENYKINNSTSNYFYNNSLIIKNNRYLEAINILNGNTFWLIDAKIKKNSNIIFAENINDKLHIFLNSGIALIFEKKDLKDIINLNTKKIHNISTFNEKIIFTFSNGKIGIL